MYGSISLPASKGRVSQYIPFCNFLIHTYCCRKFARDWIKILIAEDLGEEKRREEGGEEGGEREKERILEEAAKSNKFVFLFSHKMIFCNKNKQNLCTLHRFVLFDYTI